MTQHIINIYEQWTKFKIIVKIGKQPQVNYNNLSLDEVIRFVTSHNEFVIINTNSDIMYQELFNKLDSYNFELARSNKS